jgi:hypothetical protein
MVGWLIPIVLGALVAVALFLVVSIFSNKISLDTTPRRQRRSLANLAGVVCCVAGIYAVYPYFTLWRISNALQARDGELLASFVDWPTFRENLRSDFKARVTARSMNSDPNQSIGSIIGTAIGLKLADSVIDSLVTPETLRGWGDTHRKTSLSAPAQSAGRALDNLSSRDNTLMSRVSYAFFTSPTEYRVDISDPNKQFTVTTFLSFSNLSWKVTRLVWPESDFGLTELKTNTASAAPQLKSEPQSSPPPADAKVEKQDPYLRGLKYLTDKQYDLAIQEFDRAISNGISHAYYVRGQAWLAKKDYQRAISDFTEGIKKRERDYFVYFYRAEAYAGNNERENAIADYRRALTLDPDETIKKNINAALKSLGNGQKDAERSGSTRSR